MASQINIPWKRDFDSIQKRHIDAPRRELPYKYQLAGRVGSQFLRGLFATCLTEVIDFSQVVESRQQDNLPSIMIFWHCNILFMTGNFCGYDVRVLISEHGDGEYIAQACLQLGLGVVRGSTTRGSARALVQLKRQLDLGYDVGITPDGPKGPARQIQSGAIYLAAKTQVPIVPLGVWSDSFCQLNSWDRFRVPLPGARVVISTGIPIQIPQNALDDLPYWQEVVKQALENEETRCQEQLGKIDFKMKRGPWTLRRAQG